MSTDTPADALSAWELVTAILSRRGGQHRVHPCGDRLRHRRRAHRMGANGGRTMRATFALLIAADALAVWLLTSAPELVLR